MKITKSELRQQIQKIVQEQLSYKDVLPGADGDFVKYAQKVDDLFEEFMDKAQKLHEEGTELMKADILGGHDSSVKSAERNRYINARVGFLNKLKTSLSSAFEALRREV